MTCKEIRKYLVEDVSGALSQERHAEIEAHVADCPSCREEYETLALAWGKMGIVADEEPQESLQAGFNTMLQIYNHGMRFEKEQQPRGEFFFRIFDPFRPRRLMLRIVMLFVILTVGVAGGYLVSIGLKNSPKLLELQQEVQNMRQTAGATLISQSSPSDRLKGIQWASDVTQPKQDTLNLLLQTLDNDPNINVRLAAVEALYVFYDQPGVKEGIIHSLSLQDSPQVQAALIELLVAMRERRALQALKELMTKKDLNPEIRKQAELGIKELV